MLAPVGISAKYDKRRPVVKLTAEMTAEHTVTLRNPLHTLIELSAGNIIRLDISKAPISLIPTTMTTAESTEMNELYTSERIPVALAKLSSNVTAKIR